LADPNAAGSGALAISCVSATYCVAVDEEGNAVTYNGNGWSAPDSIDQYKTLVSISCVSETFCVAVDIDGYAFVYNGTNWSPPDAFGSIGGVTGVSCDSSKFCLAVGKYSNAWSYDGTNWDPTRPPTGDLLAVSCFSSMFCVAVGSEGGALSGETDVFDGANWKSVPITDDPIASSLDAVSCWTSASCMAVDVRGNAFVYDGKTGTWKKSQDLTRQDLNGVSCDSAGSCAAVDRTGDAYVYSDGIWSAPAPADPTSGLGLDSVSCPLPSFCVASDLYSNVLTYDGYTWSPIVAVGGYSSGPSNVSCTSPSFCVEVNESGEATTYDGSWGTPTGIGDTLPDYPTSISCTQSSFCVAVDNGGNAITYDGTSWTSASIDGTTPLTSVSCVPASFCVAVDSAGNAIIYTGSGGWGSPAPIDGTTPLTSVSCVSASFCVAVDSVGNAIIYSGSGGWGSPAPIDGTTPLTSVSCVSASFCVAVDNAGNATTYDGGWGTPVQVDSDGSAFTSVSCAATSFCLAVDADNYAFASAPSTTAITTTSQPKIGEPLSVRVTGRTTGPGARTPVGQVELTNGSQDCIAKLAGSGGIATGSCAIPKQGLGTYGFVASYLPNPTFGSSASGKKTLTITKASSTTALKLSHTKVTFGDEQAAVIAVTVSPQYPGTTPTGTVTVKESGKTLCSSTLVSGKRSCSMSARSLPVGTYHLVATYGGSADFDSSTSRTSSLTVAKATSKIALKLSASKVTYGDEEVENLSFTVSPEFAGLTPTGTVTVRESTTTLCVIALSAGKGSCTLSSTKLPPGTYSLVATYNGSADFGTSTSAKETLTVVK